MNLKKNLILYVSEVFFKIKINIKRNEKVFFLYFIILILIPHSFFANIPNLKATKQEKEAYLNFIYSHPNFGVPKRALTKTMQQYKKRKLEITKQGLPLESISPLKINIPILVGKFSDTGADQWSIKDLQRELFDGPWPTGTMKNYFLEMSYNQLIVDGTVYGWFQVSHEQSYYSTHGTAMDNLRTKEFFTEILNLADQIIDFSQYDNDGPDGIPNSGDDDGFVDIVFFVSAGEVGYNNIWPHFWLYSNWFNGNPFITNDMGFSGEYIKIDDYSIQNALTQYTREMVKIAVFCHEFGHALGLPDLYDIDLSSSGIGHWGLMGYPVRGNDGESRPVGMTAWSKVHLGWIVPEIIKSSKTNLYVINSEKNATAFILWRRGIPENEYFLIENRQRTGFDKNLPGDGLLIWHIDENKFKFGESDLGWDNSGNADETHRGVDLEEADGNEGLGDDGDPFPGSSNNRIFDRNSIPDSRDYNRYDTGISIRNISDSAIRMSIEVEINFNTLTAIIKYPNKNTFYRTGDIIKIKGTSIGALFTSYALYYGKGEKPNTWFLIDTYSIPVTDSLLGVWETSSILEKGNYTIRLNVNDPNGNTIDKVTIYLSPEYQEGWPNQVEEAIVAPSIGISDIDLDGKNEVIVGESNLNKTSIKLYVWNANGNIKKGWPKLLIGDRISAPAIGDINEDRYPEIVVNTRKKIYTFHHDGRLVLGWPKELESKSISSPSLSNMDNDGEPEIIATSNNNIFIWHSNGNLLNGWPQTVDTKISSSPVLSDVNNDKKIEIFVQTWNDKIYAFTNDGKIMNGWPVTLSNFPGVGGSTQLISGDINGDGFQEIIAYGLDSIFVFRNDGSKLKNWPKYIKFVPFAQICIGDVDSDGTPEIFAMSDSLYLWKNNGELVNGWPIKRKNILTVDNIYQSQPIIGDINGDGEIEILVIDGSEIIAYNSSGELINGWPKKLPYFENQGRNFIRRYTLFLSDIDKDGDTDLAIGAEDYVFIWDLPFTYNKEKLEWKKWQYNNWNTGVYHFNIPSKINEEKINLTIRSNIYNLLQNYPNPFNPSTTIKYQLPRAEVVEIAIYNILGKKIRTLIKSRQ